MDITGFYSKSSLESRQRGGECGVNSKAQAMTTKYNIGIRGSIRQQDSGQIERVKQFIDSSDNEELVYLKAGRRLSRARKSETTKLLYPEARRRLSKVHARKIYQRVTYGKAYLSQEWND